MFKYVYVVYVISFIVENFYLYVYMYMYIVYYVWYIFRDKCRCSKICVLVIKLNMYIMNVVDKKFY